MKILHQIPSTPSAIPPGGILSIGNFDGVHLGHQRILSTARHLATASRKPLVLMTFDPHPANLLFPHKPRVPIGTIEQRLELLATFNPDFVLVVPVTPDFLTITAEAFLREIVQQRLGISHLVEGENFTFGHKAQGTIETLRTRGIQMGLAFTPVETQTQHLSDMTQVNVSSTLIRWLIRHGRIVDAARCLGRPFTLRGQVVKGLQRGRTLGFPTANVESTTLPPAPGVYAGSAQVHGQTYQAAISIGDNPTFAAHKTTIEAHLLDFPPLPPGEELYGQTLDLSFHRWLRDMLHFGGPGPLVRQLKQDIATVRQFS